MIFLRGELHNHPPGVADRHRFKKLQYLLLLTGITLCSIFYSAQTMARTTVWKVTAGERSFYLGGTIHVLSSDHYPLPPSFERAYQQAETIVFETDLDALEGIGAQQKFANLMTFQDGQTLAQVLNAQTLAQLEEFLAERGLSITSFMPLTPVGVSLTLTMLELQRLGKSPQAGIDNHFNARAVADNKAIETLESLDQQLAFLYGLKSLDANELVVSTLAETRELAELWKKMLNAWRTGNLSALETLALTPMQETYPQLTEVLLKSRNLQWMEKIPAMLDDPDVEFVLVGALHLVGESGLIALLKEQGFEVTQLD